jgi:hypothetical protein
MFTIENLVFVDLESWISRMICGLPSDHFIL